MARWKIQLLEWVHHIPVKRSLKASAGIWFRTLVRSCSSRSLDAWFAKSAVSSGSSSAIASTSSSTSTVTSCCCCCCCWCWSIPAHTTYPVSVWHSWDRALLMYSIKYTNKMQRYTIFLITVNALHVSGVFSAHHQELKTVHTASGVCQACLLLPLVVAASKLDIHQILCVQ